MPVSVFPRLFTALLAAGVFTAFPDDPGLFVLGLVCIAPILVPVVPPFNALDVLGPGDPPVPLTMLLPEAAPLDDDPPAI